MASVENEKRSLVIVFDTTGSMHRDLQQVKSAVIQIVREFSSSGKDAIHNYVLSPFNDPGEHNNAINHHLCNTHLFLILLRI